MYSMCMKSKAPKTLTQDIRLSDMPIDVLTIIAVRAARERSNRLQKIREILIEAARKFEAEEAQK